MSCQHKYKNSKSACKSPPLKDGFCTLHYKQILKQKRTITNEENNNEVDDKITAEDATSYNQLILSDIQATFKYNNNEIILIFINENEFYTKAKEAADALCYKDTDQAIRVNVSKEDKKTLEEILKLGPVSHTGPKNLTHNEKNSIYISEEGLYDLIFGSSKKEAKAFKKFVTHTIFPSIRKTNHTNTQCLYVRFAQRTSSHIIYYL